ncbi:hypothetical protein CPB83DRAFT_282773 [Crepidotus variabilis]|uniref:Uncharacterized protein n=1 Tax=Crepidotus variabilis TaxID=179855 RepID=A0A9P6EI34_9AGAR|nr:hypothetical protein CPB83DRAFT_282773 [Crepidotus variabilis]
MLACSKQARRLDEAHEAYQSAMRDHATICCFHVNDVVNSRAINPVRKKDKLTQANGLVPGLVLGHRST